ncbi:MAG: hypothetical protein WBC87_04940 [Pseudolabrys sp.]
MAHNAPLPSIGACALAQLIGVTPKEVYAKQRQHGRKLTVTELSGG